MRGGVRVTILLMTQNMGTPVTEYKKRRRLPVVILVLALIGGAFGGGLYWGDIRLHQASAEWKTQKDKLDAVMKETTSELAALRSTRTLWEIDGRVSEALADLADNNFGLAGDAAQAARLALQKAAPDFDANLSATLAPLDGLLKDIVQAATTLSAQGKIKARDARTLVRAAIAAASAAK
jgi:hypothetical protein